MARQDAADFVFTEEHESVLTEILASHSGAWRNIRMSLNLPRSVESDIDAKLHMYNNAVCLGIVLHEWIACGHQHAKPPTLANLKKALGSHIVGLGKEANLLAEKLEECGVDLSPTTPPDLIRRVQFDNGSEAAPIRHQTRSAPAGPTLASRHVIVADGEDTVSANYPPPHSQFHRHQQVQGAVSIHAKPELDQLTRLKVSGGKELEVIKHVGVDWKNLGLALQFSYSVIKAIEHNAHFQTEDACRELLHRWLEGEACQPVTWKRLTTALRDSSHRQLALDLERFLN